MFWFDFQCHFYYIISSFTFLLLYFIFIFLIYFILIHFYFVLCFSYFYLILIFFLLLFNFFYFFVIFILCHLVFWKILCILIWFSYENAGPPYCGHSVAPIVLGLEALFLLFVNLFSQRVFKLFLWDLTRAVADPKLGSYIITFANIQSDLPWVNVIDWVIRVLSIRPKNSAVSFRRIPGSSGTEFSGWPHQSGNSKPHFCSLGFFSMTSRFESQI